MPKVELHFMTRRDHGLRAVVLATLLAVCSAPLLRAQAVRVEGESYARVGGPSQVRILEREGTYGGKVVSYWEEPDVWLEWDFEVPEADSYCVSIRYACRWPDTTRRVEIDGELPRKACEAVRFAGTGDWAAWRFHALCDEGGVPIQLQLAEGKHRIRMANVDSRGLAVDAIVLHAPTLLFDDVPVAGADASRWNRAFTAAAEPGAPYQTLISRGRVRVTLDPTNARVSMRAAGTLLWVPLAELGGDVAKQVSSPASVSVVSTGHTSRLDACLMRVNRYWQALVSDGISLHLIVGDAGGGFGAIPLQPVVYMRAGRLRHAVTWRTDAGGPYVACGTAEPTPSHTWTVGAARLLLSHAWDPMYKTVRPAGGVRVAAVKICPPEWREKGLETKVESAGSRDAVHSSARDFPALAEFYGYGRFTVEFEWGDDLEHCVLNDLASGERVVLWPSERDTKGQGR